MHKAQLYKVSYTFSPFQHTRAQRRTTDSTSIGIIEAPCHGTEAAAAVRRHAGIGEVCYPGGSTGQAGEGENALRVHCGEDAHLQRSRKSP